MRIFIDAGHGYNTAGKRTPDGKIREHEGNVNVAMYFEAACKRHGLNVVRSAYNDWNAKDDADPDITARQNQCRASGCDVAVSFHFNASGDSWSNAEGAITYVHENTAKVGDSLKLAKLVQKYLPTGTEQKDRGIGKKNLGMCNATYMKVKAAILVECAFMSSPKESNYLLDLDFCREQAEDTMRGLCEYLGTEYIPDIVPEKEPEKEPEKVDSAFKVRILAGSLNVRSGPGTAYKINTTVHAAEVYTIVEESDGWGKLKSGAGWISLNEKYVKKV